MTISKIASSVAIAALFSIAALAQTIPIIPPGGRLTLTSNTPVMTGDVIGTSTIYYTAYAGNSLPTASGSTLSNSTLSAQLTLGINSTYQTVGNIYDIFVWYNSSWIICAGPAWASSTSRGTGPGTTQLTLGVGGLWVNAANSVSCNNNYAVYSGLPAGRLLYVGSVYITASGQTSVNIKPTSASGGTDNIVGIWNAYNRVPLSSISRDSTSNWLYTSSVWREANNSANNRITWVDGLQQTSVHANYNVLATPTANQTAVQVGIDLDSTTATPDLTGGGTWPSTTYLNSTFSIDESFPPQLGAHYVQAMESVSGPGSSVQFNGLGFQSLLLDLDY